MIIGKKRRYLMLTAMVFLMIACPVGAAVLEIENQSAPTGSEVTFAVNINNAPNNVNSFGFEILYDPNIMEYKGFHENSFLAQSFYYFDVGKKPGLLTVGGFGTGSNRIEQNASGTMFTLTFKIIKYGSCKIVLNDLKDEVTGWSTQNGLFSVFDTYETDDYYTQASFINNPQNHNFHNPADEDWVKFSGRSGKSYIFQTVSLGSGCDTVIELYDADGETMVISENSKGPGEEESLAWTCLLDGIYYVKVKYSDSGSFDENTDYILQAIYPQDDAYEIDDIPELAHVIHINDEPQTHTFRNELDADWVKFYGLAEATYEIEAINIGPECDVVIELYDYEGKTLLSSKNDGGLGQDELLMWHCSSEDTYYIKATYNNARKSKNVKSFGENMRFGMQVSCAAPITGLTGNIYGNVTDASSGDVIEGINIKTNSEDPYSSISDADGWFAIRSHAPGAYIMTASKNGYRTYSAEVKVYEFELTRANIAMCPCNGDTDGTGGIPTPGDALNAFHKYMGICPTTDGSDCENICCDVNRDGECTPADTLCIFYKYLEKPSCLDYLDSVKSCR
ncbi:MAG: hypothetical protein GY749_12265 [Desulfobacteraceae bacterium]|nr:hypothetical protein [Desulfobacteraceae bacterium]